MPFFIGRSFLFFFDSYFPQSSFYSLYNYMDSHSWESLLSNVENICAKVCCPFVTRFVDLLGSDIQSELMLDFKHFLETASTTTLAPIDIDWMSTFNNAALGLLVFVFGILLPIMILFMFYDYLSREQMQAMARVRQQQPPRHEPENIRGAVPLAAAALNPGNFPEDPNRAVDALDQIHEDPNEDENSDDGDVAGLDEVEQVPLVPLDQVADAAPPFAVPVQPPMEERPPVPPAGLRFGFQLQEPPVEPPPAINLAVNNRPGNVQEVRLEISLLELFGLRGNPLHAIAGALCIIGITVSLMWCNFWLWLNVGRKCLNVTSALVEAIYLATAPSICSCIELLLSTLLRISQHVSDYLTMADVSSVEDQSFIEVVKSYFIVTPETSLPSYRPYESLHAFLPTAFVDFIYSASSSIEVIVLFAAAILQHPIFMTYFELIFGYLAFVGAMLLISRCFKSLSSKYTVLASLAAFQNSYEFFTRKFLRVLGLLSIELFWFPFLCGLCIWSSWVIPLTALSYEIQLDIHSANPIHFFKLWFIGFNFMAFIAFYVTHFRKNVFRRGVLYFVRNPEDPDVRHLDELVSSSIVEYLRKVFLSLLIYTITILSLNSALVLGLLFIVHSGLIPDCNLHVVLSLVKRIVSWFVDAHESPSSFVYAFSAVSVYFHLLHQLILNAFFSLGSVVTRKLIYLLGIESYYLDDHSRSPPVIFMRDQKYFSRHPDLSPTLLLKNSFEKSVATMKTAEDLATSASPAALERMTNSSGLNASNFLDFNEEIIRKIHGSKDGDFSWDPKSGFSKSVLSINKEDFPTKLGSLNHLVVTSSSQARDKGDYADTTVAAKCRPNPDRNAGHAKAKVVQGSYLADKLPQKSSGRFAPFSWNLFSKKARNYANVDFKALNSSSLSIQSRRTYSHSLLADFLKTSKSLGRHCLAPTLDKTYRHEALMELSKRPVKFQDCENSKMPVLLIFQNMNFPVKLLHISNNFTDHAKRDHPLRRHGVFFLPYWFRLRSLMLTLSLFVQVLLFQFIFAICPLLTSQLLFEAPWSNAFALELGCLGVLIFFAVPIHLYMTVKKLWSRDNLIAYCCEKAWRCLLYFIRCCFFPYLLMLYSECLLNGLGISILQPLSEKLASSLQLAVPLPSQSLWDLSYVSRLLVSPFFYPFFYMLVRSLDATVSYLDLRSSFSTCLQKFVRDEEDLLPRKVYIMDFFVPFTGTFAFMIYMPQLFSFLMHEMLALGADDQFLRLVTASNVHLLSLAFFTFMTCISFFFVYLYKSAKSVHDEMYLKGTLLSNFSHRS